jgi:hypothetical protein
MFPIFMEVARTRSYDWYVCSATKRLLSVDVRRRRWHVCVGEVDIVEDCVWYLDGFERAPTNRRK